MVQVPEGWQCQLKVNIMSNRKKVMLTKDAPLYALIWLFTFCKLDNFFLFDLASIKTLLACSILWGIRKTDFFKLKVSQ